MLREGRSDAASSLPFPSCWASEDDYVQSLLTFASTSEIFRTLCGGVHILDFLTRDPDLYTTILPQDWRDWVNDVDVHDFLHLLLRHDIDKVRSEGFQGTKDSTPHISAPPASLLAYIETVRNHCLIRFVNKASQHASHMPPNIAVGMKPKKIHEVNCFASYVDDLASRVSERIGKPISLIDFGSGQNYLGRTLSCLPYQRHVVAIEQKHHNVTGAQTMDVLARVTRKQKTIRNKKEYKRQLSLAIENGLPTPPPEEFKAQSYAPHEDLRIIHDDEPVVSGNGSMTYIEYEIQDGHLERIISQTSNTPSPPQQHMTISLHSCGNLSHHAIRSLPLNQSVSAIAIIGCCYNLLTERLGPATYKHPLLRSNHPRLHSTSTAYDPHGFPMSRTLETFPVPNSQPGIRLNITARMMAVQAPGNWGHDDSELFFTRHFYRALLQRIFFDFGIVKSAKSPAHVAVEGNSLSGADDIGTPLIIGSLRKSAFSSFHAYFQAALEKLTAPPPPASPSPSPSPSPIPIASTNDIPSSNHKIDDSLRTLISSKSPLLTHDLISSYLETYAPARKNLAVIWCLMAFSAGVVESVIAVDRWLYLKEQECVSECWVEPVFDYGLSPRNLCVVGIRKVEENEA